MSAKKNVHVPLKCDKIRTKVLPETNKQMILAFRFVFVVYRTVSYVFERLFRSSGTGPNNFLKIIKAHANGRKTVCQQHATFWGPIATYIRTYFIIISPEGLFSDNPNYKNYKHIISIY